MTVGEGAGVLASFDRDFPRWYQDVLDKAQLAESGPVRGTMVIRPYAYAIWERMQAELDAKIKSTGAENVYLPLLIPESFFEREAQHVEGFNPELAVVTHAAGRELTERAVIRPTSETVFGELMAKWIQSHRDLPLKLNQWANVVRWELRPRMFLRTTEFLWQEGHTAHATQSDAAAYARAIHLQVYRDFLQHTLAIPVLVGMKSPRERFAGAINTFTCEAMMGDGKALQMATSHELGQNFSKAFGITYTSNEGIRKECWTTSWGSSTRMLGGLIMAHGDQAGLQIPPRVAATQVVVIVAKSDDRTVGAADAIMKDLTSNGIRARGDFRNTPSFGRRVVEWELKGVPVRIIVGPRGLDSGTATVRRRDDSTEVEVRLADLREHVKRALEDAQANLFAMAERRLRENTTDVTSIDDAISAARTGFARIPYSLLGDKGEDAIAEHALTIRCLQDEEGRLPNEAEIPEKLHAVVARSY